MRGDVGHGVERERRRDREAIAHVTQSIPGDRDVDGQHQSLEARRPGARHQLRAGRAILPHIQLKPFPRAGRSCCDVLDRRRPHGGQCIRDAVALSDTSHRTLTLMVHEPREAGGRERKRRCSGAAQNRCGRVNTGHVVERRRRELQRLEHPPSAAQADLTLGSAVGVIEHRPGDEAARRGAQVGNGERPSQAAVRRVELHLSRTQQRPDLGPFRQLTLGHMLSLSGHGGVMLGTSRCTTGGRWSHSPEPRSRSHVDRKARNPKRS
jgi:hypothetical protein